MHRALCLSLSFSARWCVCWKQVCSLSLSGTKARGGSDAWRLWCVCRWQALCAAVPPIAVCQGCFCVLLLLVVLVVFWWWAMEPLGVCVAMLAWLAFVCVVCCVLATQHVVQTWHCVCVDDALLVVVVVDDDGALDGCLWSMSDGVEGRMGQGNGAVLLLLLLEEEEEEERLPPVFFVLCVSVCLGCGVVSQDGQLWCAWRCFVCVQCSAVRAKATRRRAWRAKMAKTTQHDSEHWGAVCVFVFGWLAACGGARCGGVCFEGWDGAARWWWCEGFCVVILPCFGGGGGGGGEAASVFLCVCGHGKVLVAFWVVVGHWWWWCTAAAVLWCFVVCVGRGQRTEEGERSSVCLVCVWCCSCVFLPSPKVMWMDGWMDGW